MMAIEKLVLIIIFIIILVVVLFLLTGYVLPTGVDFNLQNELRECCQKYRAYGCPDVALLGDIQCSNQNTLFQLYNKFKFSDIRSLQQYCLCKEG